VPKEELKDIHRALKVLQVRVFKRVNTGLLRNSGSYSQGDTGQGTQGNQGYQGNQGHTGHTKLFDEKSNKSL